MRGPIDYIVVGFDGQKFEGAILQALGNAVQAGTIAVLDLAVVAKDEEGSITKLAIEDIGDAAQVLFSRKDAKDAVSIDEDDISEVSDLLEPDTAAGLLVVEQLWAKPFKKAIIDANGYVIAEGRIHPDAAAAELTESEE